ncbi:AGAP007271-PA-like protein [Anopheles sinensis]|uniref:AGAP007271-PA-like protein n=1 Tax=Anopheles sinensis TaxID=74873 RepID=A0A084VQU0_ANOSI|nr:AGAP007271-PA-like protein [Anopheles sinensis]
MKFGVWALSLAVICSLQWSVSAEPRPDFALEDTVYGATKVSLSVMVLNNEVGSVTSSLPSLTLQSNDGTLGGLYGALNAVGYPLEGYLEAIAENLDALATSDDSSDFSGFASLFFTIESAQNWITQGFPVVGENMDDLVGGPLAAQFHDALARIYAGLEELQDALEDLASVVQSVLGSSEESSCPRREVPPRYVYRVVYAVRALRGYVPLVRYLIVTTVENLHTADDYLVRLAAATSDVIDVTQYTELVENGVFPIVTHVAEAVQGVQTELGLVVGQLSSLTSVQSLSSYSGIVSALSSFGSVLNQLSSASSSFYAALEDISVTLETFLTDPDNTNPMGNRERVVETLLDTLLSNGPFSRYCFYKYSEILLGFTDLGYNGVEECIDRELERLQFLEETLLRLVAALEFDFEDLFEELTACEGIRRTNRRSRCVSDLASTYNSLASNFDRKFDLIYETGIAEAVASKYRLLACVQSLTFRLLDESTDDLRREIKRCRRHGPYCEQDSGEAGKLLLSDIVARITLLRLRETARIATVKSSTEE